jgi:hypothetical protein
MPSRIRVSALIMVPALLAVLLLPHTGAAQPAAPAASEPDEAATTQELNKQLNNPVSSVWSLNFQNNFQFFEGRLADQPTGSTTSTSSPCCRCPSPSTGI